jgi:hypothetical protein
MLAAVAIIVLLTPRAWRASGVLIVQLYFPSSQVSHGIVLSCPSSAS